MSDSLIFCTNSATQTVASGGTVNFGSVVRKFGSQLEISGGNITATGKDFYDIFANLSFTATAGTAVISLLKDGVIIPGAQATITTVADTSYSVSIPAAIRDKCCCDSVITCIISGVIATVANASMLVQTA